MNVYADLTLRLVTLFQTDLPPYGYTPLAVNRGVWLPRDLPVFDRYMVWVAPPVIDPVTERRHQSSKLVNYILRADIYLLVKNFDEDQSVWGDVAPNHGVFQLQQDTREILRNTDLGGLVERTYRETEGGSSFETGVAGGFDTGSREWVHRLRLTYTAQTHPFCHPTP